MSKDQNDQKDPTELRAEEKKRIVEEAIASGKENMESTAEKYDMDIELLETWVREIDVTYASTPHHLDDEENVDLEVTDEFADHYEYGVTPDKLNYGRLTFWSIFGTVVILLFIVAIMFTYQYTFQSSGQQASEQSQFYDINELQEREQMKLSSFGVVDLEEGVYRIPIDSAIARIAKDSD